MRAADSLRVDGALDAASVGLIRTVYIDWVISLPKTPYIHSTYMVPANPKLQCIRVRVHDEDTNRVATPMKAHNKDTGEDS